jgi:predicted AlkP superfamily pyrophosphatase or phosphodiesterase
MPLARRLWIAFACLSLSVSSQAQTPSVLMISIDGLRPDYVTQADQHQLRIPNLRRFLAEGTYADGVTGVLPTLTYPSHTTLVTGVAPAVHGISSNTTFDPLFQNQVGWFWYAEQVHAQTLWQAAHARGIVTASLNWPVTVDAPGIDFNLPEYWRASTPDDLLLMRALAHPLGLQQQLEHELGPYIDGNTLTIESDATRTRFAVALLRQHHPGFFTVHLSSLDEEEHLTAPFSPDSNKTLEALDGMIGQLRDAALAANPDAVVVIVSDHGFARTDFHTNPYGPLLRAGLITLGKETGPLGTPVFTSWKATLWPAGGSAAIMVKDPADTASRDAILKIVHDLAADPANGIDRIVTGEELHQLGGFPQAIGLVLLKTGYQLGYTFSGPIVTPAPSTGMHGYLPSNPEMRSSFFVMGKGIAPHKDLGLIDMRQIAPAVGSILGLTFNPAGQIPLTLTPLR